jgi:hypothetical protein
MNWLIVVLGIGSRTELTLTQGDGGEDIAFEFDEVCGMGSSTSHEGDVMITLAGIFCSFFCLSCDHSLVLAVGKVDDTVLNSLQSYSHHISVCDPIQLNIRSWGRDSSGLLALFLPDNSNLGLSLPTSLATALTVPTRPSQPRQAQ